MVQLEPNLQLVLKHLAPSGVVLSAESTAALDHSLPIKRREAGLQTLVLWGRLLTRNGKDYLIAEGHNQATARGQVASFESKYYFSQDGIRWADLPALSADTTSRAAKLRTLLTGDSAHQYNVEGSTEHQPAEEEPADASNETVSEVQRLRYMIDSINASAAVLPKGSCIANAHNNVVPNPLFGGLDYPDKLESYVHRSSVLEGGKALGLAADVRGSWSMHSDSFKGVAVLRSLLYPGYCFYYSSHDLSWGGLYVGDGIQNTNLVFMI